MKQTVATLQRAQDRFAGKPKIMNQMAVLESYVELVMLGSDLLIMSSALQAILRGSHHDSNFPLMTRTAAAGPLNSQLDKPREAHLAHQTKRTTLAEETVRSLLSPAGLARAMIVERACVTKEQADQLSHNYTLADLLSIDEVMTREEWKSACRS